MSLGLTRTASQVFDPIDISGNPRGAAMAEARTWGTEIERSALQGMSEVSIASAATTNLGTATSFNVAVTGNTTITSFGTVANIFRRVRFVSALLLTHNATSLILPGGANILTKAGDVAEFISDGSGNWRCTSYQRADGRSLTTEASATTFATRALLAAAAAAGTIPATVMAITLLGWNALGDMPPAVWTRMTSAPAHALKETDAVSGTWAMTGQLWYKQAGAAIDGITDDLPALNRAIDYARNSGYRTILCGSGNSYINGTNIDYSGVVIQADDPNRFLFLFPSGVSVRFNNSGLAGVTGGELRDLCIWAISGNCGYGVYSQGTRFVQGHEAGARNVKVTGTGTWDYCFFLNGQLNTPTQVMSAIPASAGTGFAVGNILTVSGGTFTTAATLRVEAIGGGGSITTFSVVDPGVYTTLPGNPATLTGGAGTGATAQLTANSVVGLRGLKFHDLFCGQANIKAFYALAVKKLDIIGIGTYGGTNRDISINGVSASFTASNVSIDAMNCQGNLEVITASTCDFQGAVAGNAAWTGTDKCHMPGSTVAGTLNWNGATNCTMGGFIQDYTFTTCSKCMFNGSRGAGAIASANWTTVSSGNLIIAI